MENETLSLLTPPPQERLNAWLTEIYGKAVPIKERKLLRHRDLSYVERLKLTDAMPESLIYKVVLPPWDVEQDLHEHILIPEVSNSARLYLSGTYQGTTALFMEDLGEKALLDSLSENGDLVNKVGTELAKLHRSFTYRIAEVRESNVLQNLLPSDFAPCANELADELFRGDAINAEQAAVIKRVGELAGDVLADEQVSLVHGDLYAENILFDGQKLWIIDWSWFSMISAPIIDLATVSMKHFKNGALADKRDELLEAYCAEYSRDLDETIRRLPYAEAFSRLLFLRWLAERRRRGITGTTVGPVEILIGTVVSEMAIYLQNLDAR